jgi:hypothetical protein
MKKILLFVMLAISIFAKAQAPKLYIHFVSHNEPTDNLQTNLNYTKAKLKMFQMAEIIDSANLKWNVQSSDGFVFGARNDQNNTNTNVFKTLATAPYNDNVEIDPRSKNLFNQNIADQWYLLDSLGGNPTHALGGCIYSTDDPSNHPIDWEQYRNPIIGTVHGNSWQCDLITGAGSYPPHQNDLNDFGVFKPDSPLNFYQHNESQNLWCIGVGCAPLLDSLSDEQAIIDLIQGQVDSIQSGLWPSNKFYVTRIMTNQSEFGPLFFTKLRKVIDSLTLIPSNQLVWANIGETFVDFEDWRTTSSQQYSQWLCGETYNYVNEITGLKFDFYPNPTSDVLSINFEDQNSHLIKIIDFTGKEVFESNIISVTNLNVQQFKSGVYFAVIDSVQTIKFIKE